MRKWFVALSLVLAIAGLSGQAFAAEKSILFVNKANVDIKSIHLAPAGTKQWGPNLLVKPKLKVGRNIRIAVPHDEGNCQWDLKYVGPRKMAYTISGIDICKAVEIDLFLKDDQAWANIK